MNYLCGMAGGTAQPPAPTPDNYEMVNEGASIISNYILTGANCTRQEGGRSLHGVPTGQFGRSPHGDPTGQFGRSLHGDPTGQFQRGGPQQGGPGQGGIPAEIHNNEGTDDIRSLLTGPAPGGGGYQGTVGGGETQLNVPDEDQRPVHTSQGGAIAARIDQINNKNEDTVIERELNWQSRVEGDNQKITAFRDQAVNQTAFRAFAFMKGKSPALHLVHSVGQFYGMSGLAVDVQGKCIGFIGDRGNGRNPFPFILPTQNAWSWARVQTLNDTAAFTQFYADADNTDKLWTTGATGGELSELTLPRMLALPTCVAEFIKSIYVSPGKFKFFESAGGPKASETISQRRFLPKLFICKIKIHD